MENAHLKQKQESVFTDSGGLGQSEWSGVKSNAQRGSEEATDAEMRRSCRGLCKNFPQAKPWKSSSLSMRVGHTAT